MPPKRLDHDRIVAMACAGSAPAAIAGVLNVSTKIVSNVLWAARRRGEPVPRWGTGGARTGHSRIRFLPEIQNILRPAASQRGLTTRELAGEILETVARNDLVDAVLDDGGDDD